MKLCVIPARGGSKRIPRKNVRLFHGKPMIAWSIEAAKASECFDDIWVSTDDREIAEIARDLGANVPFGRPAELADDYATTIEVMRHALTFASASDGPAISALCCLYATAPFVQPEDLSKAEELLRKGDWVIPVTNFAYPVQRALKITKKQQLEMLNEDMYFTRSQDLFECYHDAGLFYWAEPKAWQSDVPPFSQNVVPLILPRTRVQDIDTPEDWDIAEKMFEIMQRTITSG